MNKFLIECHGSLFIFTSIHKGNTTVIKIKHVPPTNPMAFKISGTRIATVVLKNAMVKVRRKCSNVDVSRLIFITAIIYSRQGLRVNGIQLRIFSSIPILPISIR